MLLEPVAIGGYNTHRPEDKQAMLQAAGKQSVAELFDAIPASLRLARPLDLPEPLPEWALMRHMQALSAKNATVKTHSSFLGGGAYEHNIPAVIDAIAGRGEFLTSYTPYQPEISQGLLQALFEYQSALTLITGLPVVNGSCYDGATALADAAWTCCLISGRLDKAELLASETIWPQYRQVINTYLDGRGVARQTLPFAADGRIDSRALEDALARVRPAGFLFQTPNALGVFEDVKAIAGLCARHGVPSVCSFHPLASGIVPSPGELGIDIVTCDGQPLGLPLNAGGPSLGVFATRREYRQYVPGRLVGKVTDINGHPAYALVYEDREQHVARERATSNICSNQALNALRAVMFLASLGGPGLAKLAALNARKSHYLAEKLAAIPGVTLPFRGAFFNEFVITLPRAVALVQERLMEQGIFGGIDYSGLFGLDHALLVTVTETKTRADLDRFAQALKKAIVGCCLGGGGEGGSSGRICVGLGRPEAQQGKAVPAQRPRTQSQAQHLDPKPRPDNSRGSRLMRPTVFDKSRPGIAGHGIFDGEFAVTPPVAIYEAALLRPSPPSLPELSEIEVVRHYTGLSLDNHGVDSGTYPLGSCTMKYNPKRNDAAASLTGFRDAHPHQPPETLPGLWEMMHRLQRYIAELTGMDDVSLQPAAGAHGELAGLLIIRKYYATRGDKRSVVLIADAAHGTNPASAAMAGFTCRILPTTRNGLMDMKALERELTSDVAALMLTNPSTFGLFEEGIEEIARLVHGNGSLLYYDGANMNALMGIARPGDMGFDVMHLNVHKTLSTPHGGGGPGGGPVGVRRFLRDYLPAPVAVHSDGRYSPRYDLPHSIGRVKSFYGHVAVLVRAYAYILTMGAAGLKEASENAVLNANYVQARLSDFLPPVFDKTCMHECLLSGSGLTVSAYSFAKRLIDYGIHPPTLVGAGCVYFGDALKSAMLIEPTETETKESLDHLIAIFRTILGEAQANQALVETAPHSSPVGKVEARSSEIESAQQKETVRICAA